MPIPRRISQSALQAIQPAPPRTPPERSGAFAIAADAELDDEFAHFGELPSLMPPPGSPALRLVEQRPRVPELGAGPPKHRSMEMPAVRVPEAPPPSGRVIGDSFEDEDEAPIKLDLAVAPASTPKGFETMAGTIVEAAPIQPVALRGSGTYPVHGKATAVAAPTAQPGDPLPGIVAFAGYGIAPTTLSGSVSYAFRVMMRRAVLRSDMKIARMRRLPQREIDLYEAAIRCADERTVTKGIAIAVTSTVVTLGAIAAAAAALL